MPSYDASRYNPPAPIALVSLRNPATGATVTDQKLLIDTGADATLLPRTTLEQLGIQPLPEESYELTSFDGTSSVAQAANVDMIFLNFRFRGRYLLIEDETGVLGRDVLNLLRLVFDGPRLQWTQIPS